MPCSKRRFTSIKHARLAHKGAGFRIRPYWCNDCSGFHVTNAEKRRGDRRDDEYIDDRRRTRSG
jgi:hypothetical protein